MNSSIWQLFINQIEQVGETRVERATLWFQTRYSNQAELLPDKQLLDFSHSFRWVCLEVNNPFNLCQQMTWRR